jgi:hypothetical protein
LNQISIEGSLKMGKKSLLDRVVKLAVMQFGAEKREATRTTAANARASLRRPGQEGGGERNSGQVARRSVDRQVQLGVKLNSKL